MKNTIVLCEGLNEKTVILKIVEKPTDTHSIVKKQIDGIPIICSDNGEYILTRKANAFKDYDICLWNASSLSLVSSYTGIKAGFIDEGYRLWIANEIETTIYSLPDLLLVATVTGQILPCPQCNDILISSTPVTQQNDNWCTKARIVDWWSVNKGMTYLWDKTTYKLIKSYNGQITDCDPSGRILAITSDNTTLLVDIKTNNVISEMPGCNASFSFDGNYLVTSGLNNYSIYDIRNNVMVKKIVQREDISDRFEYSFDAENTIGPVCFSPRENKILCYQSSPSSEWDVDEDINILDVETQKESGFYRYFNHRHDDDTSSHFCLLGDGSYFVNVHGFCGTEIEIYKTYELQTISHLYTNDLFGEGIHFTSASISKNKRYIALLFSNGSVIVIDVEKNIFMPFDKALDTFDRCLIKNKNSLVGFISNGTNIRYKLPQNVQIIEREVFCEAGLAEIEITEGLQEIKAKAFYRSPIKRICFPESLKAIPHNR